MFSTSTCELIKGVEHIFSTSTNHKTVSSRLSDPTTSMEMTKRFGVLYLYDGIIYKQKGISYTLSLMQVSTYLKNFNVLTILNLKSLRLIDLKQIINDFVGQE